MARDRSKEKIKEQLNIDNGKCRFHSDRIPRPGTTMCDNCLDSRNERKQKLIAAGKCRNHPKVDLLADRTQCDGCLASARKREAGRKDAGFCISHPKAHLERGTSECNICLDKRSWARIRRAYNLTKEQYFIECEKRNYQCDLCKIKCLPAGQVENSKSVEVFNIDHDHKTNNVRGFLCHACNILLGQFYEDKNRIELFIENVFPYLEKSSL